MIFKWSHGTDSQVYEDALKIRHEVFVEEQGWTEEENVDGLDDECHHLVGYVDGEPVVTARLYSEIGDENTYGIQRVATIKEARGSGYGTQVLDEIRRHAKDELKISRLEMDAQTHAIPFYEKNGYEVTDGEEFDFLGISHHKMHMEL